MNSESHVHYEVAEHIAVITLARTPVNALNIQFLDDILAALGRAAADDEVRAVILQSALPELFCAGLDLHGLAGKSTAEVRPVVQKLYVELWDVQTRMGKPTIAVINGAARGGGMTLAISCDVILAAEDATFGYPEIKLGLLPAIHFAHLPPIAGRHCAFELLFSGNSFSADEAVAIGLANRVVPGDSLATSARELATTFAGMSPTTMQLGRAAFIRASDPGYRQRVAQAVEDFCAVWDTADAREGLAAFLEKRQPTWD